MSVPSTGAVSVNGMITSVADARIPAMDHGFLFGDSVYEVIRTFDGRPLDLPEHLERLRRSAAELYFELPWTDAEIRDRVKETFEASGLDDAYVRMVLTRGPGPMSLLPTGCDDPTIVVYVLPLKVPTAEQLRDGITVVIPARLRNDLRALAPSAKTGNYLNNALALMEAHAAGGEDAVMLNAAGHLTEATTANIFWVKAGTIRTPSLDCGILAGITRTRLILAMQAAGLEVEEGAYPLSDLLVADEAFLTGTLRGVMPVVRVGAEVIGAGRPGPITARVGGLHREILARHAVDW